MKHRLLFAAAAALSLIGLGVALSASEPPPPSADSIAHPVVVELFTAQGCSSCPPANDNFATLADRPDVLALSFGVTYWDYLGWKDTFAQSEFTRRQVKYEAALGHSSAFTPQIVINGRDDVVGNVRSELTRVVDSALHTRAATLTVDKGMLNVGAGTGGPADVWLVRYNPGTVQVPIARGENSGRTLPHRNVVRQLLHLGSWNGQPRTFTLPSAEPGLRTAILLQRERTGPILAAWKE